jgi:Xaa-Pro aminopeptidase
MYKNLLKECKCDGVLITKPENVFYLSGFGGSFGEIILTNKKTILITDSRYKLEAEKKCKFEIEIVIIEDYFEDLNIILKKLKIKNLGFESTNLSYARYLRLKKEITNTKLIPVKNEIDQLRMIKNDKEIELIILSQRLNEQVLAEFTPLIRNGVKKGITELELATKIKLRGLELGAEDVSFEPIVAFGKNAASPHYAPTNYKLKSGEAVLVDMGFKLNGYCSDMSRTFLPTKPTNQLFAAYNAVLDAQENCIENIKPGMTGVEADELSRSVLNEHGLAEYFTHANGHGVGLEIHEAPSLSSKSKHNDRNIVLAKNMVVTVEPGVYIEGKFGIRIEDMLIVGSKNITEFTK